MNYETKIERVKKEQLLKRNVARQNTEMRSKKRAYTSMIITVLLPIHGFISLICS